ncbi:MAG: ABC transporter ATP-binding protein [Erysipelotrichaceae bacterium]|nr:ABC transporter ATP-binding protein [Erysipelotrichaceae bacterium]
MLRISNVSKSYKDKAVLKDLNLEIEDGSVFGLIGVNGAGKSTLLRCIAGVLDTDEGHIELDGSNTFLDTEIKEEIVFVSDDPYFPPTSTIANLRDFYSAFYHFDGELYQKYLKMFNLDENKQISSFSKGMRRQTVLLLGMAIQPKVLLLDECFDGLDPLMRLNFKKTLVELIEDKKITVIISSHNLKELEDICDSFGILENGKVDTYGDLLESKANINKYQVAYEEAKTKEFFKEFDVLNFDDSGRVIKLVIKGDKEEVMNKLEETKPLLIDVLPVNFEELFIYEVGTKYE